MLSPLCTLALHRAQTSRRKTPQQSMHKHAHPRESTPLDMVETIRRCDTGTRPMRDVLLNDRAIFMNPWCAATVIAQLSGHGVGLLAQINFLGAARAAASGQNPMPAFRRFVALALVLQAVPKTVAAFTAQRWHHTATRTYDQAFIAGDFRRPRLWVMRQGASATEPGSVAPNQEVVRTDFFTERLRWGVLGIVESSQCLLDDVTLAAVNLAFFSHTMGPLFTAAVGVSMALTQGLGWAGRRRTGELNRDLNAANTELRAPGLRTWDNLVLGNPVNRDPWLADLRRARGVWAQAGRRLQQTQMRRTWVAQLVAGVPILAAATHHATTLAGAGGAQAIASEFLPVLPRLVNAVANANSLRMTVWDSFVGQRQSFLSTLRACNNRPALAVEDFIKADWITVSHNNGPHRALAEAARDLEAAVSRGVPGRWTIRGRNTAGKSMTLLGLMEAGAQAPGSQPTIAPGAFMLPAKSRLAFAFDTGSSGETGLAHVREAVERGPQVLLFDECTAHLDGANTAEVDRLIEAAARDHTVVEIRHR